MYGLAHEFIVHGPLIQCEACNSLLNSEMLEKHRAANCDDKKGAESYSLFLKSKGFWNK